MIGVPILVLGVLVAVSAVLGPRIAQRPTGTVGTFLLAPFHPATWRSILAIVLGSLTVSVAASIVVAGLSTGVSLLFLGVGIVVIGVTIELARLLSRVERWRARIADPRPLLAHPYRPYGTGLRELVLAVFVDESRWLDIAYLFVAFPLVMLELLAVVVLWALALASVSLPVWLATDPSLSASVNPPILAAGAGLAGFLVGLVLVPFAAWASRSLMTLHRVVVAGMLCESERRQLERRVRALEGSRRAVIAAEASELRRIERDLHDGAQQRLVALTMDLGLAAERIETDPTRARALVLDAQDQARQALTEIRDLVRGIAPPILLDRGLVPALSAIAARSPVPTSVESDLPDGVRLPDATERAAYFVVAEALANVAKHSKATRAVVRLNLAPQALTVTIEDDGPGGAVVHPGGGLAGLQGRVQALDGQLRVDSPAGGPTIVSGTLPVDPAAVGFPTTGAGDGAIGPRYLPATPIPGWRGPGTDQPPR